MIGPTGAVRVMVATRPVDFHKGADGLAALVRESMAADPFSGAVYVFRAKRADRIKLVFWDGTGLCLFAKRLEDGIFRWPKIEDGVIHLSAAQLSALLEGLDWRRVHAARETVTPARPSWLKPTSRSRHSILIWNGESSNVRRSLKRPTRSSKHLRTPCPTICARPFATCPDSRSSCNDTRLRSWMTRANAMSR